MQIAISMRKDRTEVGMGVGLRLNTPVLVIRLDVGFPIPREPSGPLDAS